MASSLSSPPLKSLTPELLTQLKERSDKFLFETISTNWKCKFCQTADELSIFRHAVGSLNKDEQEFLRNFRELVPLTVYDAYQPFVARFFDTPCQESEVIDLFAPGLPAFIASSSATSGKAPKFFAKYKGTASRAITTQSQSVYTYNLRYRKILNVFRGDQDIVRKIIVTPASGGLLRMQMGWNPEQDEDIMSFMVPGETAPHAVAMVTHHPSFLLLHALFALANRGVDILSVLFCTTLLDMFMYIERDWSSLVDAIDRGTIPDFEHIEHVRDHLERHLHPNPVRAAELRSIGAPSKTVGWAKYVWPNLKIAFSTGSGPFSSAVPKVKHILGPDVILQTPGYGCSECVIGATYQSGDLNRFKVLLIDAFIEYLDVDAEEVSNKLCAAWEVKPGRLYEPVLTTCNGLWRYRLGDVVELLGFAPDDGSPVVRFVERRNVVIKFDSTSVTETQLVQSISSATQDTIGQVMEFTCFKDARELPSTVGFFVELANEPGKPPHFPQRLRDALSGVNENIRRAYDGGAFGMPTIRVVKPGTFAQYRKWRGEAAAIGTSQVKVPVVMSDTTAQGWIMNRVEREI
ncbi:GH3 auxin-responsive promoter [Suillus clintonianus]|uniref:GH3 auxin-responsive promoter n=1 Tax=Suillus clintonianus TaxID=1904413 RepID=UPI001B875764|nr:GH3 auxin-responsive promoter [Suillus clintonianus]KAG2130869.1 GH3 auxin-responsive promoter [Suillus clintonianus]